MKDREVQLHRLLGAARKARLAGSREPVPASMPAPLRTRILAHWHAAREKEGGADFLLLMFRRALTCAGILMLAAAVWSFTVPDPDTAPSAEPGDLLASFEVQADLLP